MTQMLKFQTPVKKAYIVPSILFGMILAKRAHIGKKLVALEIDPKMNVEP